MYLFIKMAIDDKISNKQQDMSAIWGCFAHQTFQRTGVDRHGDSVKYCTLYSGLNQQHSADCGYAGEPIDIRVGDWGTLIPYRKCEYVKASALALIGE